MDNETFFSTKAQLCKKSDHQQGGFSGEIVSELPRFTWRKFHVWLGPCRSSLSLRGVPSNAPEDSRRAWMRTEIMHFCCWLLLSVTF